MIRSKPYIINGLALTGLGIFMIRARVGYITQTMDGFIHSAKDHTIIGFLSITRMVGFGQVNFIILGFTILLIPPGMKICLNPEKSAFSDRMLILASKSGEMDFKKKIIKKLDERLLKVFFGKLSPISGLFFESYFV